MNSAIYKVINIPNNKTNNEVSLQLPPNNNSPPIIDNFITFYLKSQLKNKKLELNPKMYKEYKT